MDSKLMLLIVVCLSFNCRVHSSQDVLKTMSINYIKSLNICIKEMDLPDSVVSELANFWKEGYQLTNRLTGCTIVCLSTKLDLIEPDGSLHHGNTAEFAKKHGADDAMAQQLVDLLRECEHLAAEHSDPCMKAIHISNCFKAEIRKADWAPDIELVVGEVLAGI